MNQLSEHPARSRALEGVGAERTRRAPAGHITLQRILVQVLAETSRHVGHADIVRETVDGAVGYRAGSENLPEHDERRWSDYVATLTALADAADLR